MTEETTPTGDGSRDGEGPAANDQAESAAAAPTDAELLQHLGASVLLCWNELPFPAQVKILAQTSDVVGTRPIAAARNEIIKFLLRHTKI